MKTLEFFSTKERLAVLNYVLFNHGKKTMVRKLSRKINVSASVVSKCINFLKKEKIIDEKNRIQSPKARALKVYLNIEKILDAGIDKAIKKELKPVSAGLYGSWANGTNYSDSDIDIWIRVKKKPSEEKELKIRKKIKTELKAEPSILILTEKEIEGLRKKDYPFYCALIHSIALIGEGID